MQIFDQRWQNVFIPPSLFEIPPQIGSRPSCCGTTQGNGSQSPKLGMCVSWQCRELGRLNSLGYNRRSSQLKNRFNSFMVTFVCYNVIFIFILKYFANDISCKKICSGFQLAIMIDTSAYKPPGPLAAWTFWRAKINIQAAAYKRWLR